MSDPKAAPRRLVVRIESVDRPVGVLEDVPDSSGYRLQFTYAPRYRGSSLSAAMPPRKEPYENAEARAFFDNLLPEGPQRRSVVPKGADGARPIDEDDVVGLLSALGRDCPGAVMVLPEGVRPLKVPGVLDLDYAPLIDQEVKAMLRAAAQGRIPAESDRVSLPGVQRKVALSYITETETFLRSMADGVPSTHFLKVEPTSDPRFKGGVVSEVLCMCVASAVGLPVAEVMRIAFDDLNALLVRRYDRTVSNGVVRRLHQEDATQALGLDRKQKCEEAREANRSAGVADLFGPFSALTASPASTRDIIRRAVFLNWLLGTTTATSRISHCSILRREGGQASHRFTTSFPSNRSRVVGRKWP